MSAIPQRHCSNILDHESHDWFELNLMWVCPGRFTPTGFLTDQPIAHPMDSDPFSCIPGAYED